MSETDPPDFAKLLDWLEGKLPAGEATAVAERMRSAGPTTQADLDWLSGFLEASRAVHLVAPPDSVRAVLRRRFEEQVLPQAGLAAGLFQRLVAALTFDSRTQATAPGLRSASAEGLARQLIYSSDVAEVVLSVQSGPDQRDYRILGQVLPIGDAPPHAFSIQLLRGTTEFALAVPDALGEFSFQAVPPGEYDFVVSAGQYELLIPGVMLRP